MTWQEIRDRRMRVLLELVGVDEAEKLGVSAFSLALDRLEAIDAKHAKEVEIEEQIEAAELSQTFADTLSDDVILPPLAEEFVDAMSEAWANGCGSGLYETVKRWNEGRLIIPQIARLIDESDWPLPDRLSRAHKAFMLDWEGEGYEGRHTKS